VGIACAANVVTDVGVRSHAVPLGLPRLPDRWAHATPEKIALGRRLFFDRRLSFNNTLSCAMCHIEEEAFASTQSSKAVGMEGQTLRRNAPTLFNVAYQKSLFHDGREAQLELQIWLPLLASDEMANPSIGYVLQRIVSLDDYAERFASVYPGEGLTSRSVGDAIAAFEATLLSGNSRFDRWRFAGDEDALTPVEKNGFALFTGKAGCVACHTIEADHALFTDHLFHNTGIGYRAAMGTRLMHAVELAPGETITISDREIRSVSETPKNDVGRFEITLQNEDRWAYKTPSLRDVSRTPPYMHDGSIRTLEDVVAHYNTGGVPNDALSPRIKPLGLSQDEQDQLVAFLRSLDGQQARSGNANPPARRRPHE